MTRNSLSPAKRIVRQVALIVLAEKLQWCEQPLLLEGLSPKGLNRPVIDDDHAKLFLSEYKEGPFSYRVFVALTKNASGDYTTGTVYVLHKDTRRTFWRASLSFEYSTFKVLEIYPLRKVSIGNFRSYPMDDTHQGMFGIRGIAKVHIREAQNVFLSLVREETSLLLFVDDTSRTFVNAKIGDINIGSLLNEYEMSEEKGEPWVYMLNEGNVGDITWVPEDNSIMIEFEEHGAESIVVDGTRFKNALEKLNRG